MDSYQFSMFVGVLATSLNNISELIDGTNLISCMQINIEVREELTLLLGMGKHN